MFRTVTSAIIITIIITSAANLPYQGQFTPGVLSFVLFYLITSTMNSCSPSFSSVSNYAVNSEHRSLALYLYVTWSLQPISHIPPCRAPQRTPRPVERPDLFAVPSLYTYMLLPLLECFLFSSSTFITWEVIFPSGYSLESLFL